MLEIRRPGAACGRHAHPPRTRSAWNRQRDEVLLTLIECPVLAPAVTFDGDFIVDQRIPYEETWCCCVLARHDEFSVIGSFDPHPICFQVPLSAHQIDDRGAVSRDLDRFAIENSMPRAQDG